jgi:hypothetical protein
MMADHLMKLDMMPAPLFSRKAADSCPHRTRSGPYHIRASLGESRPELIEHLGLNVVDADFPITS